MLLTSRDADAGVRIADQSKIRVTYIRAYIFSCKFPNELLND